MYYCSVISCIRDVVLEYILYKLHILIISHHRVVVLKLNGVIYLQKRKREVKLVQFIYFKFSIYLHLLRKMILSIAYSYLHFSFSFSFLGVFKNHFRIFLLLWTKIKIESLKFLLQDALEVCYNSHDHFF